MQKIFPTNKKPFSLLLDLSTTKPKKIRIEARDSQKPYTYYYKTVGDVNGYREYILPFPQTPNELIVNVYDAAFKNYEQYLAYAQPNVKNSFTISKDEILPLKTYPVWLSPQDVSFIKFAQKFSENAGIYSATHKDGTPSIYRSDNGKFTIDYYDKIRDRKTKQFVNTPARIGHETGVIEVSKSDFMKYTVPMRIVILLHEYSHKYKNPDCGLKISNESGADINALNMYLSLGYSPIEAHQAFLYVFATANNEFNHNRYKIIKDFISKFYNGELQQYVVNKEVSKK